MFLAKSLIILSTASPYYQHQHWGCFPKCGTLRSEFYVKFPKSQNMWRIGNKLNKVVLAENWETLRILGIWPWNWASWNCICLTWHFPAPTHMQGLNWAGAVQDANLQILLWLHNQPQSIKATTTSQSEAVQGGHAFAIVGLVILCPGAHLCHQWMLNFAFSYFYTLHT